MDSLSKENIKQTKLIPVDLTEEMKKSYLAYALSVIVGRALPDVRDGLKPVHRRILYAMHEMGLYHNKPFKKSARVVGDVLGKYHPHGDSAVYDALVRMAQPFSMNIPLIEGHGNFGSIDGDAPAAMRYTEVRLAKIAEEMLADLDKETVDFVPNFDNSLKEPIVLPTKLPNLLVNGSMGIAVGLATNIPPHNLNEVCDAIIYLAKERERKEEISTEELMQYIKGPDFPTAGTIYDNGKIKKIYENGRGILEIWSKVEVEEKRLIVTEIPYQINKSKLVESIANLVKEGKIDMIKEIRDESNREGIRIVIDLKKDANPDYVLNYLYAHTPLKVSYGIVNVALVNDEPRLLSLKDMLWEFIQHRFEVITRRSKYELKKAEEKKHILDGFIIALANINRVVQLIKSSRDKQEASQKLMKEFPLTEVQVNAILQMQLVRLTSLEVEKIKKELEELEKKIIELKAILEDKNKVYDIIIKETQEIKEKYGYKRRTEIVKGAKVIEAEELIEEKDIVIILTKYNYIKRLDADVFKEQKRGGVGVKAIELREGDSLLQVLHAHSKDTLLFFSNKGKVYNMHAYAIEEQSRTSKGRSIYTYFQDMQKDEKIIKIINVKNFENYLVFLTNKGYIKKVKIKDFAHIRRTGIKAISLHENEEVSDVKIFTSHHQYALIISNKGQAIRFPVNQIKELSRIAHGIIGMRFKQPDKEFAKIILPIEKDNDKIAVVLTNGYGKVTSVKEISVHNRGGKGMRLIKGEEVAFSENITQKESVTLITKKGLTIKIPLNNIPLLSRNARGVKLINLKEDDKVVGGFVS